MSENCLQMKKISLVEFKKFKTEGRKIRKWKFLRQGDNY